MSEFPDWPEWRLTPYADHQAALRRDAEHRVEAARTAEEMLSLLRSLGFVVRERAAAYLSHGRPDGAPSFMEQLLVRDPEPIFDALRQEPNSWAYNSLLLSVCDVTDRLPPEAARRVSAVVRELAAHGEPSSRRWITWQAILGSDRRRFVEDWLEGFARERLLSEPENSIRYKLAEQIFGIGYRVPRGLLEFTNQWARHVGYKTGYVPPWEGKWPPKDRAYFAGETRPLLAPQPSTSPRAAPTGTTGTTSHAAPPVSPSTAPAPAPTHVSIEHTKKSIKAQGVLARVLLGAGIVVLFTPLENRLVIAGATVAGALVWLQWLKVRRWWEHG